MKSIPLESVKPAELPTVANRLDMLTNRSGIDTPESVLLHDGPFGYIDTLAKKSAITDAKTQAIVLTEKDAKDPIGMVIVRFAATTWSGVAEKQPKRKDLEKAGPAYIVDQLGIGPNKMVEFAHSGLFEDGIDLLSVKFVFPFRETNTRSRLLSIIGKQGLEEYPSEIIGEKRIEKSKPYISHSEVSRRRQVYCGRYQQAGLRI